MKKQKKPTKLDNLTAAVAQDYAHVATEDIVRQRIVLACKANTLDSEILAWQRRLDDVRRQRAEVEATMRGLASVVEKR